MKITPFTMRGNAAHLFQSRAVVGETMELTMSEAQRREIGFTGLTVYPGAVTGTVLAHLRHGGGTLGGCALGFHEFVVEIHANGHKIYAIGSYDNHADEPGGKLSVVNRTWKGSLEFDQSRELMNLLRAELKLALIPLAKKVPVPTNVVESERTSAAA
ncbi:MAG: hypothetical protein RL094_338 [Candidatus Parcubacteria bacterium]|jgi:hypothetical protein